jgi:membrane protein implicated in regulation of membrane protease activity
MNTTLKNALLFFSLLGSIVSIGVLLLFAKDFTQMQLIGLCITTLVFILNSVSFLTRKRERRD